MSDSEEKNGAEVSKKGDFPAWVKYVLSGIGGVIVTAGGGIWLDYTAFRKTTLEANSQVTSQAIEADDQIRPILDKYIQIHIGKAQNSEKDKDVLRKALRNAYDKALNAKNHWRGLDGTFETYANALTELKTAADSLVGPLDGRKFAEAYGNYIAAEQDWRQAVQRKQSSYIASF